MNTAPGAREEETRPGETERPRRAADSRSSGCGLRTSRISVTSPTGEHPQKGKAQGSLGLRTQNRHFNWLPEHEEEV